MGGPTRCGKLALGVLSGVLPSLTRRSRRPGCTARLGGGALPDELALSPELVAGGSPVL